ncbi:MAG: helix-turn-helix domain-containing protein [Candidatus Scalinduaceae bacterium]
MLSKYKKSISSFIFCVLITGIAYADNRTEGLGYGSRTLSIPLGTTLEEVVKKTIIETLQATNGNKSKAAKILGISEREIEYKLKKQTRTDSIDLLPGTPINKDLDRFSTDGGILNHYPKLAKEGHSHIHEQSPPHHAGLHFSHPLIAESPSPDTKVRLDYFYRDIDVDGEKARESTIRFEAEYAFHRAFSIEVDVPYTFLDPDRESENFSNLDTVEVALKFANFAFEEHNLLLGYGIEFGLPTGDEKEGIGSNNIFEFEPFLDIGYKWRNLEVVAFGTFGIPTNQDKDKGEEVETELGYNVSLLYHFTPRIQGLLELDGESVLSGDDDGDSVVNISPGIKFRPLADYDLIVGTGVSIPLSSKDEFDIRTILSIFYHF